MGRRGTLAGLVKITCPCERWLGFCIWFQKLSIWKGSFKNTTEGKAHSKWAHLFAGGSNHTPVFSAGQVAEQPDEEPSKDSKEPGTDPIPSLAGPGHDGHSSYA